MTVPDADTAPNGVAARLQTGFRWIAVLWTLLILALTGWRYYSDREAAWLMAKNLAQESYNKDILYRRWASRHGGVYAPIAEHTLPNPYLDVPEREIATPSGKALTLINLAYMTRQVHELGAQYSGVRGHITSLKPIRPGNVPDAWERRALEAFEQGIQEVVSLEGLDREPYLRFMRPMIAEKPCLKCHAIQGYREGEIRGGISISVPWEPYRQVLRQQSIASGLSHGVIWALGLLGLWLAWRRLRDQLVQRHQAVDALQRSEEQYRRLFERANDAIFVLEKETGRYLDANRAAERLTGRSIEQIKTLKTADICPEGARQRLNRITATADAVDLGEVVYPQPDGTRRIAQLHTVPINDQVVMGIAHDITEIKAAQQRINHLAYYDALTGLPNRALLTQRAGLALALAARRNEPLTILFVDLDRFKDINDSLGHGEGDELLTQTGRRLQGLVRTVDTVARLGSDVFVLLLPEVDQEGARRVADKLLTAFREPFLIASHRLHITLSIGIALYPHDGGSFDELLKNADTALHRAKDAGRNTRVFYAREMNIASIARLLLETELHQAIQQGHLRAYYQPKLRLADNRVIGAEALVRWEHPKRGLIPPNQFIPVAEASDLIVALGDWMLDEVARQLAVWRAARQRPLCVAVNLAARHFREQRLVDHIADLLRNHDLPAEALELELTESTLLETGAQTAEVLQALKQLGVGLAVDDFGTGYSSLGYLKRLPITALKIDQRFVRDLESDSDDRILARTIVALGHGLGLTVVAEGVETEQQRRILLEQGCDLAQGYLFSRPLPADELTNWLARLPLPDPRQ